ncbi:hypothetical protein LguiA_003115 [Lonicera macranthoides]
MLPKAEHCPNAINEFYNKSKSKPVTSTDQRRVVDTPMGPLYLPPQDFQEKLAAAPCTLLSSPLVVEQLRVHEELRESLMETLSPIPQEDAQKSLAIVPSFPLIEEKSTKPSPRKPDDNKPVYCPEAIVEYYNLGPTLCRDKMYKYLRIKVKNHLCYAGWEIFFIQKSKTTRERRYQSPSGKRYNSLITACEGYLDEQGKFDHNSYVSRGTENINASEEANELCSLKSPTAHHSSYLALTRLTDSKNDLDSDFSIHMSRRTRQVAIPPSSRQNPRNILARLIDSNEVSAGAEVHYRGRDGRPMAEGHVTRDGIKCHCCQEVFNLSNFEAHAGSTNHRPAANIFLKDGRSLQECQLVLKHDINNNRPREVMGNRKYTSNGYKCSVCHNGGALVLCYQCPSSFHTSCLGLEAVPNGDWFCQLCEDQPTNEAEYCPQAIVDYFLGGNILTRTDNKKLADLRSKAKKHLCSVGWSFIYTNEGTRRQLQYKSPSGRGYVSLLAACEGCIFEDGSQPEQLTTLSD